MLEESIEELAAELYAFFADMISAESPVLQTISAIPKTAIGPLIYECYLFVTLDIISRAQTQYTEPQLKQLADNLSFQFSLFLCNYENDDSEARQCEVRAAYDKDLAYRFERNLRGRWAGLEVWLLERIARALVGERPHSRRESLLIIWLNAQLRGCNVSVPKSVLDSFAGAIAPETDKIISTFFCRSSTDSEVCRLAREAREIIDNAMDHSIPNWRRLNRLANSYKAVAAALARRRESAPEKR